MKNTVLVAGHLLLLGGCATTFEVQPSAVLTKADMTAILSGYSEQKVLTNCYNADSAVRDGRTKEQYRDSVISLYISAIDQRYYTWSGNLSKGSKGIDAGAGTVALALSSAASLSGLTAAHALAAASSVVSGTNAVINQKLFLSILFLLCEPAWMPREVR